jgi:hypothetical protein
MMGVQQCLAWIAGLSVVAVLSLPKVHGQRPQLDDAVLAVLTSRQYDLQGTAGTFSSRKPGPMSSFSWENCTGTVKFPSC